MAIIDFNANEVEPNVGFDAIPAGKYQAVIIESEMKSTRNGNGQYLELTFEVIDGEYKGRKIWSRLNTNNPNPQAVKIAKGDLSAICRSVGVMVPRDTVELHNLPMGIDVTCRKNPDTGTITNDIKSYFSRDAVGSAPAVTKATPTSNPAKAPWDRS